MPDPTRPDRGALHPTTVADGEAQAGSLGGIQPTLPATTETGVESGLVVTDRAVQSSGGLDRLDALLGGVMAANEEMLMWATPPTAVASAEVAERIVRAGADAEMVGEVVAWFVRRHAGLYGDLVAEVEAACPKGVPNDYYHEVEKAAGWVSFEHALRKAVGQLDELMPDGFGWPCCARMDPVD